MQALNRHAEAIIEAQVQRWRIKRKTAAANAQTECRPIITLSREFGSQGATIGKIVAEKLDYSYWDKEVVHAVAQQAGLRDRLIEELDEHVQSLVNDFVTRFTSRHSSVNTAEYLKEVSRLVHTLENQGNALIIGRGGQYIAQSEHAFRIRIVCPHGERVQGFAERQHLAEEDARAQVDATENERRQFYQKYYNRDVTDACAYDLVFNSSSYSHENAADLIIQAYFAKFENLEPPSSGSEAV